MSICSNEPQVTNIALRDKPFEGSILPPMGTARDSTGRLSEEQLDTIYRTLVSEGKLVSNQRYQESLNRISNGIRADTKGLLETIGIVEKATMQSIQNEFCFNYVRYKYSLNDLFDYLVTTSQGTTLTTEQTNEIKSKLNKAKSFNEKLNDLIQITNYIAKKRSSEMEGQNTQINSLNESITSIFGKLANQNKLLKGEDSLVEIRKRMLEYAMEKNNSAANLLAFYGFLNIIAIGLLVYSYRA
jgi:polyhydroxyalkanoate synthesis regulator phasin